jgi:hypothetical protein
MVLSARIVPTPEPGWGGMLVLNTANWMFGGNHHPYISEEYDTGTKNNSMTTSEIETVEQVWPTIRLPP